MAEKVRRFRRFPAKKSAFLQDSTTEALDIMYMWRYNRTTTIRGIFAPEFAANRTLMEDTTMYDIPVTLTTNPKKKPEDESKLGFGMTPAWCPMARL